MGAIEEGGKVAGSIVEGLKTNPSCLAALAVVALYGVLSYFENSNQNARIMERTQEVAGLLKSCLEANNDITKSITKGGVP